MKNIVLFGGAFDPIHNGHINMALNASKILDADVFFIPARVSVWKTDSAPIKHKIKMIELALKGHNRVFVDTFEANSTNEINYSIDTVKHFKETYKDAKLFLLIGTDQVNKFHLWKNADEIAKMAQIIYFGRPYEDLNQINVNKYNMLKIEGNECDISSTDIKQLKKLNTPVEVINYIVDNNLYFINKIKPYLTVERFNHSVEVAKLAYEIAEKNGLEIKYDCYIAGLLHDIGKNVLGEESIKIMKDNYPEYLDMPLAIWHQFIGRYLLEKDFNITNQEILAAVEYHTTGNSNMSDMAKIVYAADKIEPTRGFDSKWLIDAIEVNLDNGFSTILKDNVKYFELNHKNYKNRLMIKCLNQYLKD